VSILNTLSIAAQSLKNQQLNIQTTGHNLSNAATPGFSRQRVELSTELPLHQGTLLLGQGSKTTAVQRVVDRFLESALRAVNRDIGSVETEQRALTSIQEIFPTSGGLDAALGAFFSALSDLANNPAGIAERMSVVGKASVLGEGLRSTRDLLTASQRNLDEELQSTVSHVNALASQIAELNKQISIVETDLVEANDFRDQRQSRIQEIVRLSGATIRDESNGSVTVIMSGFALVSGGRAARLDSSTRNAAGHREIVFQGPDGLSFNASGVLGLGGKIGALVDLRDNRVQAYVDQLDEFAFSIVNAINSQHVLGFDLSGAPGSGFFSALPTSAGAAALVRVDDGIATDPRRVAAASSAATAPGDNRNILALLGLREVNQASLGGLTFQESYSELLGQLGNETASAQGKLEFREALLKQTQAQRESVSGVNIDEEMTKIIVFQRAFDASSLIVRTADEMYSELIEMTR
jgi:flagellar hook-associated protein 1 FlgK